MAASFALSINACRWGSGAAITLCHSIPRILKDLDRFNGFDARDRKQWTPFCRCRIINADNPAVRDGAIIANENICAVLCGPYVRSAIEPAISTPALSHRVVIRQIKRLRSRFGARLFLRARLRRGLARLFIRDYRRSAAWMIDFTPRKLNDIFLDSFNLWSRSIRVAQSLAMIALLCLYCVASLEGL